MPLDDDEHDSDLSVGRRVEDESSTSDDEPPKDAASPELTEAVRTALEQGEKQARHTSFKVEPTVIQKDPLESTEGDLDSEGRGPWPDNKAPRDIVLTKDQLREILRVARARADAPTASVATSRKISMVSERASQSSRKSTPSGDGHNRSFRRISGDMRIPTDLRRPSERVYSGATEFVVPQRKAEASLSREPSGADLAGAPPPRLEIPMERSYLGASAESNHSAQGGDEQGPVDSPGQARIAAILAKGPPARTPETIKHTLSFSEAIKTMEAVTRAADPIGGFSRTTREKKAEGDRIRRKLLEEEHVTRAAAQAEMEMEQYEEHVEYLQYMRSMNKGQAMDQICINKVESLRAAEQLRSFLDVYRTEHPEETSLYNRRMVSVESLPKRKIKRRGRSKKKKKNKSKASNKGRPSSAVTLPPLASTAPVSTAPRRPQTAGAASAPRGMRAQSATPRRTESPGRASPAAIPGMPAEPLITSELHRMLFSPVNRPHPTPPPGRPSPRSEARKPRSITFA